MTQNWFKMTLNQREVPLFKHFLGQPDPELSHPRTRHRTLVYSDLGVFRVKLPRTSKAESVCYQPQLKVTCKVVTSPLFPTLVNKQTNKHPNTPTNKHPNKQTNKQTNTQQTNKQTNKHPNKQKTNK